MKSPSSSPGLVLGAVDTIGHVGLKAFEVVNPFTSVQKGIEENRDMLKRVLGGGIIAGVGFSLIN